MNKKEQLKQTILNMVAEYYKNAFGVEEEFVPGKTRVNYAGRVFDEKELINLVDSSLEFWLTYGRYSKDFEEKLADYLNIKHVLLVNSGSSANLLAFMALTSPLLKDRAVYRGDEVITVAAGFPTTIAPIMQYGAIPVFVDIDINTCNIDTNMIQNALSSKTKAVMLAHTMGNPFDISKVKDFCSKNGLWLIEDNCDALGSKYDGRFTGTMGDIGTSSFYPPHHMTMGEGGAVYTNNPILKTIMLSMRDWGRECWCDSGFDNSCGARFTGQHGTLPYGYDHKYVYSHLGYNLKPSDMQAAIGCAQIEKLHDFTSKRKANFEFLKHELEECSDYFILPSPTMNSDPSWFGYILTIKDGAPFKRNEIVNYLEERNIQTRNLFAGNIICHPCFDTMKQGVDYRISGSLTQTNKVMTDSFWIGLYPGMTTQKLKYMTETIKQFILELDTNVI